MVQIELADPAITVHGWMPSWDHLGMYRLRIRKTPEEMKEEKERYKKYNITKKINPMIGAAGISAFPMSARVVHKMGLEEDPQNFLLMHSIGVNVSGQIASVIAGGIILNIAAKLMGG